MELISMINNIKYESKSFYNVRFVDVVSKYFWKKSRYINIEFNGTIFDDYEFNKCEFIGCKFIKCTFIGCKLYDCEFKTCEFIDIENETCDFIVSTTKFITTTFTNSYIYIDFEKLHILDSSYIINSNLYLKNSEQNTLNIDSSTIEYSSIWANTDIIINIYSDIIKNSKFMAAMAAKIRLYSSELKNVNIYGDFMDLNINKTYIDDFILTSYHKNKKSILNLDLYNSDIKNNNISLIENVNINIKSSSLFQFTIKKCDLVSLNNIDSGMNYINFINIKKVDISLHNEELVKFIAHAITNFHFINVPSIIFHAYGFILDAGVFIENCVITDSIFDKCLLKNIVFSDTIISDTQFKNLDFIYGDSNLKNITFYNCAVNEQISKNPNCRFVDQPEENRSFIVYRDIKKNYTNSDYFYCNFMDEIVEFVFNNCEFNHCTFNKNVNYSIFINVTFQDTTFKNINMINTKFTDVKYDRILMKECEISNAEFKGCELLNSTLNKVHIINSHILSLSFISTELYHVKMEKIKGNEDDSVIHFSNCKLVNMELTLLNNISVICDKKTEIEVNIDKSNISKSEFDDCDFNNTVISNSILDNIKLSHSIYGFNNVKLQNVSFKNSNIDVAFTEKILENINFENSTFGYGSNFLYTKLYKCNFKNTDISNLMFENAIIEDTNFELFNSIGTKFNNTNIRRCNFKNIQMFEFVLTNMTFYECNFNSAVLHRCILSVNTRFEKCKFVNPYFISMNMNNVVFKDCTFENITLDNVTNIDYTKLENNYTIIYNYSNEDIMEQVNDKVYNEQLDFLDNIQPVELEGININESKLPDSYNDIFYLVEDDAKIRDFLKNDDSFLIITIDNQKSDPIFNITLWNKEFLIGWIKNKLQTLYYECDGSSKKAIKDTMYLQLSVPFNVLVELNQIKFLINNISKYKVYYLVPKRELKYTTSFGVESGVVSEMSGYHCQDGTNLMLYDIKLCKGLDCVY